MEQFPIVGLRYLALFEKYVDDGFYSTAPAQINISWQKRNMCRHVYVQVCKELGIALNDNDTDDIIEPSANRAQTGSLGYGARPYFTGNASVNEFSDLQRRYSITPNPNITADDILAAQPSPVIVNFKNDSNDNYEFGYIFFFIKKGKTIKRFFKILKKKVLQRGKRLQKIRTKTDYARDKRSESVQQDEVTAENGSSQSHDNDVTIITVDNVTESMQEKTKAMPSSPKLKHSSHLEVPTRIRNVIHSTNHIALTNHVSVHTTSVSSQISELKQSSTNSLTTEHQPDILITSDVKSVEVEEKWQDKLKERHLEVP
ncbi:hypothetical protein RFI_07129, partial [Reticulomyxa filosa]